jgi:hypothetical protein
MCSIPNFDSHDVQRSLHGSGQLVTLHLSDSVTFYLRVSRYVRSAAGSPRAVCRSRMLLPTVKTQTPIACTKVGRQAGHCASWRCLKLCGACRGAACAVMKEADPHEESHNDLLQPQGQERQQQQQQQEQEEQGAELQRVDSDDSPEIGGVGAAASGSMESLRIAAQGVGTTLAVEEK